MRAICVEDEEPLRQQTLALLRKLPRIEEAVGFGSAEEALTWMERNRAELALLDIALPGMNGMELAAQIKTHWPSMAIVFVTARPEYALEAFELHVSGYVLKPLTAERLAEEASFALERRSSREQGRVEVRTFGGFDVLLEGKPLSFRQARCKELLAYLVDRRGSSVTRTEAFAILWEDRAYDRSMQKQLDAIIRSLRATLREYGIESIFEMENGMMRIRPEQLRCDLYRFCLGEPDALSEYRGEYMKGYGWAELTEGYMTGKAKWRTQNP